MRVLVRLPALCPVSRVLVQDALNRFTGHNIPGDQFIIINMDDGFCSGPVFTQAVCFHPLPSWVFLAWVDRGQGVEAGP